MSDTDNIRYFLWLTLTGGISTHRVVKVYRHFGSAKKAYRAKEYEYNEIKGLKEEEKKLFYNKSLAAADEVLNLCHTKGIGIITAEDSVFPKRLLTIEPMPLLLYFKGSIPKEIDGFSISIVGTREPSDYGIYCAKLFAEDLTRAGVLTVSGMAKGIDGIVHKATIKAGGQTVAVLGCSVDYPYPLENKELYYSIIENGAVISEYPPVTRPLKHHFPMRNRLISGLTLGTLIVETKEYGGSLITARWAIEQGRDVFSVPGPITRENSKGANALIRDGAVPVTCVDDILFEYEELYGSKAFEKVKEEEKSADDIFKMSPDERISYFLSREALHISDLSELCGMSVDEVSSRLLMLEMDGKIKAMSGGYFAVTKT